MYTKGPWVKCGDYPNYIDIRPSGQVDFSYIARINAGRDEYGDNANLIAAAPDMFEALEALLEGRPTNPPPDNPFVPKDGIAWRNWRMFEKARAALAKARGET